MPDGQKNNVFQAEIVDFIAFSKKTVQIFRKQCTFSGDCDMIKPTNKDLHFAYMVFHLQNRYELPERFQQMLFVFRTEIDEEKERVRRMLFTVLNRYDQLDIEEKILDYARKKNIDIADFSHELAPGISVTTAIGDVVLSLIEQAAEEDKQDFKERQRAGIDRARASGQTIGRPSQKQPKRFQKICQMYRDKRVTGREAAKIRWLREDEQMRAAELSQP